MNIFNNNIPTELPFVQKKYKQKIIVKIYKEIFTIFANEEIYWKYIYYK